MSLNVHVFEATIDPNVAPSFVGQHWVNTTTDKHWLSVGTAGVGDWKEIDFSGHSHTVAHSATTGQTANDHHNELHTVASHSDTTATGAELNELTDGSNTTLHTHVTNGKFPYDACVAASGGDYTSVKAAFDAGHNTVFVRDGTYIETGDIVIPTAGVLMGESVGGVTIYFNNAAYSVKVDGSGGTKETAGTISITHGTTAVTGSGTTFTNLSAGDYILLDCAYQKIGSITDNTNLVLDKTYQGKTLSGVNYQAQTMAVGGAVVNVIIASSTTYGLYVRAGYHFVARDSLVINCGGTNLPSVKIIDSAASSFSTFVAENSADTGIDVENCSVIKMVSVEAKNNAKHGINTKDGVSTIMDGCIAVQNNNNGVNIEGTAHAVELTDSIICVNNGKGVNTEGTTSRIVIDSCNISSNNSAGVDFDGDYNIISNSVIKDSGDSGIFAGDDGIITGCHIIENSGHGIDLSSSDSHCVVSSNYVESNTSKGINVDAGECSITGNVCNSNVDGIYVTGDNNIISSNFCEYNSQSGIEITSTADKTIVVANNVNSNTGTNYVDNGTNTDAGHNKT